MKYVKTILLTSLTAAAVFTLIEGGLLFRQVRLDLAPLVASANVTVANANATLDKVKVVADTVNVAAVSEKSYWDKTQVQVYKLITDTKEIMVRTDRSLNDVLIPRVATVLDSTNTTVLGVSDSVHRLGDSSVDVVSKVGPLLDATTAQVSDPAIKETITHLDESSANTAHATADLSATMGTVRKGVDYEVSELMKPVKKIKLIGEEAVRIAGKFFGY